MLAGNRLLFVTSALGVAVLLALGTWQVQRLQWKLDLIEKRQSALVANPVTLADIEAGIEHGFDIDWLKVKATGRFSHDNERHVYHLRKGKIGWRIVTPFIVPGQFIVLVDRGFVPDDRKQPATRRPTAGLQGPVEITGYVRTDSRAGLFTPDNDPAGNRWYNVDLMAMAATLPDNLGFVAPDRYAALLPVFIRLEANGTTAPGSLPLVDPVDVELRNNHLQYAITWYALAMVLIVIAVMFSRSRRAANTQGNDE